MKEEEKISFINQHLHWSLSLFSSFKWLCLSGVSYVMMALEGHPVTLTCKYSGSVQLLFWYQQESSSSAQLLMAEYSEETERFSFRHNKTRKEFHLQISSAAVSDSAVYYCALQPTVTGNSKTLYKNLWNENINYVTEDCY
uniref:Ig-like domain-containing protein n=1 Tax=Anabas testudineus TaxID=64144 RepID=A0A3Q1HEH7_ANATE